MLRLGRSSPGYPAGPGQLKPGRRAGPSESTVRALRPGPGGPAQGPPSAMTVRRRLLEQGRGMQAAASAWPKPMLPYYILVVAQAAAAGPGTSIRVLQLNSNRETRAH